MADNEPSKVDGRHLATRPCCSAPIRLFLRGFCAARIRPITPDRPAHIACVKATYLSKSRLGDPGEASSRGEPSYIYPELALVPARLSFSQFHRVRNARCCGGERLG